MLDYKVRALVGEEHQQGRNYQLAIFRCNKLQFNQLCEWPWDSVRSDSHTHSVFVGALHQQITMHLHLLVWPKVATLGVTNLENMCLSFGVLMNARRPQRRTGRAGMYKSST
jgi:hypothetical protein